MILFCVLFGLSMDYEVFLLTPDEGGLGPDAATTARRSPRGLERSGRIVTSAALIVVVVAGSFAFADIVLIKALGLGMAIAVALDATVVRALLVPATMRLLGRWNWWVPARLERLARAAARAGAGAGVPTVRRAGRPSCLLAAVAVLVGGCAGAPILANPPADAPPPPATSPRRPRRGDPQPIEFPADDGPHDRLTEWWYYTGHLVHGRRPPLRLRVRGLPRRARRVPGLVGVPPRADGRDRAAIPVRPANRDRAAGGSIAAGRRRHARRASTSASGRRPVAPARAGGPAWTMSGASGTTGCRGTLAGEAPRSTGRELRARPALATGRRRPVLHERIGFVDFGPAGGSYYYSRPRMAATGDAQT